MNNDSIILSVDAMGGAYAPGVIIEGMASIASKYPKVKYIVFGDSDKIFSLLSAYPILEDKCEVVHCSTFISDEQQPVLALKRGKESSMRKAIDALHEGRANACVSGGNTGALMVMSKMVLGTIHGIKRPAIVSIYPNFKDGVVMLDLGANSECDAHNLFQFALMGHCFAQIVLKKPSPTIGILNVGIEENKGRDIDKKAYALLKSSSLNFYGYIEGDDIIKGTVNVVVTDGFSGNIVLKTSEGLARICKEMIKITFQSSILSKIAGLLVAHSFKKISDRLDPRSHNGAMLIGVDGIVVKSHGSSDAIGFANALEVTINLVKRNINDEISELLSHISNQDGLAKPTLVSKIKKKLGLGLKF